MNTLNERVEEPRARIEPTYKDLFAYHVRQIARSSANRWGGPMCSYIKAARGRAKGNLKDPDFAHRVRENYLRDFGKLLGSVRQKEVV